MWIKEFKLAILNEDIDKIENLSKQLPDNLQKNELQIVSALIKEALSLLTNKREEASSSLKNLKNIKKYTGY